MKLLKLVTLFYNFQSNRISRYYSWTPSIVPGSQQDSHNCVSDGGYQWCESTQTCIRPWEHHVKNKLQMLISVRILMFRHVVWLVQNLMSFNNNVQ